MESGRPFPWSATRGPLAVLDGPIMSRARGEETSMLRIIDMESSAESRDPRLMTLSGRVTRA
jgi:hypothetical protein